MAPFSSVDILGRRPVYREKDMGSILTKHYIDFYKTTFDRNDMAPRLRRSTTDMHTIQE